MTQANNPYPRLDVLHIAGNNHNILVQLRDVPTNAFIDISSNPIALRMVDARNIPAGTAVISNITTEQISIDISKSIPPNYIGRLRYVLEYTDNNTGTNYYVLSGNIDCVDAHHTAANTAAYVQNNANVVINTSIGVTNNIVLDVQNGKQGATGPQGPQGVQGIQGIQGIDGPPGTSINITFIAIDTWVDNVDELSTGDMPTQMAVVLNNTGADITMQLIETGADAITQPTIFVLARNKTMLVFRNEATGEVFYNV
jgi:hypothetical protein